MRLILFLLMISVSVQAVVLEDYLPSETRYDTSIPTPKAVTGVEVGERHYRHDQIVHYLSVLAASSSRARLMDYGLTNEGRRLVLLLISSDKNMENPEDLVNKENILRVWNGFSVHGNEASGANASVLYAYHLVAGHSDQINSILNETLIIIDPTINPDGYDRFITDVNSMRGLMDNPDENDSAHIEQSPNGRTNHYWFDLNRDWLLLSQMESRARIVQFHRWNPHVLDDHHEMGSDRTFFFQPGVPERTNPLIPKQNIDLTNQIGTFHAKTLSEKGMRFYTQESYDDFYPGKGSTYPDLHGSVGILFEQASARGGHLQTSEGVRKLSEGIDNQLRTAISTLTGAYALKSDLLTYKNEFFEKATNEASKQNFKGYLLDFKHDNIKAQKMADYLRLHNIQVSMLNKDYSINKIDFKAQKALYIPIKQAQYTLIRSLFSSQTRFQDNTFYDVSSWNIAMAWGLDYAKIKTDLNLADITWSKASNHYQKNAMAYAFNWNDGNGAAALNFLQQRNIMTHVASKPFSINKNGQKTTFNPGAIIIPVNENNEDKVLSAIANLAEFFQVPSHGLTEGLNTDGVDLGSPSITTVNKPNVLMAIGEGIDAYQSGSIWYLFDTEVGVALTKIRQNQLNKMSLNEYTHLILPSGRYQQLTKSTIEKISQWIKQGGNLIALQQSADWAEKNLQGLTKNHSSEDKEQPEVSKAYGDFDNDLAQNTIGGAIVSGSADLSHPLAFGMHQQKQYVLFKGNSQLQVSNNPYVTPLKADQKPLAAGYISDEKVADISETPLVIADKLGQGSVIKFGFNPTFRGYWLGTQQWLINAIYFSSLIKKTEIK